MLEPVHEFVLCTPALPEEMRTTHNLRVEDTDHLPVVIDVAAR